ncbi:MAG: transglutaminase-like domain-containing protein [Thaumarchaeota archaeon]|nr:transglutaminase-like domain-containing protein [Nitrososphaerota archaeon]
MARLRAHPRRNVVVLFLAIFLYASSLQAVFAQPAAPATTASDPPSSVTVLAGCSYFSSLRFTNNVPQYVTANPQYQSLNFTSSTCVKSGTGFLVPQPKAIPPIFFLRGTTITIRAVCTTNPECLIQLSRNPMAVHDPTSSSVSNLEINLINGTAISITIPPNAAIGRYHFSGNIQLSTAQFSPCQLLDPFSAWFWVIYNASPGSTDTDVNGLNATQYSAYVLGQTDIGYFGQSSTMSATNNVKTVTNKYMGGPITFTLGPQKAVVYLAAMQLVDNAKAWNTANASVTAIALGASNGLPSGWPVPSGKTLLYNVPVLLTKLQNPTTAATVCGQCMVYAAVGDALSRSLGVPTRMTTTINSIAVGVVPAAKAVAPPGAWTWNFHVWDEVWLNQVTRMNWSAFDPSKGNAFGSTPINPIKPIPTNALIAPASPGTSFAYRFATGALPGAAAGACPCSSTAYVTSASGARTTDTAAYRSPLPDPGPVMGPVTVSFDKPSYVFGDSIDANVTVTNPSSLSGPATVVVTLYATDFGGINLEGPWPVATLAQVLAIPANGAASETFVFSAGQYQTNGDFVAIASATLGDSALGSGYNYTTVNSGLSLQLTAPQTVQVGHEFNTTVQVTNDLLTTLSGSSVAVLFPTDVTPTVPTNFTVPSLGPGASETFTIPAQAGAVPELYVISAEASSAAGGISSSAPITVNATDPPEMMAPIDLRAAGQSLISPLDGTTSTDSASTSTIVTTCSTTSTSSSSSSTVQSVPEFPSVPPLVAAATLFALIVLGGLVLRVRKGSKPIG